MARRGQISRINPDDDLPRWVWPAVATFGALVVVSAIANVVRQAKAPIYFYWTESRMAEGGFTDWVPMLQQEGQSITFELSPELTESMALWAAEDEIRRRGGKPRQGRPVG